MAERTATSSLQRARPSALIGGVLVLVSIALSAVSYGYLADTIRIRWTIGTYQHYGPEYVSTLAVLVVFPVAVSGLYAGSRWLKTYLKRAGHIEELSEFRAVYDVCVLLTLGTVIAVQLALIILNL